MIWWTRFGLILQLHLVCIFGESDSLLIFLFLKSPAKLSCGTSVARLIYMTELFKSFWSVHTWFVTKVYTKSCSTLYADMYFSAPTDSIYCVLVQQSALVSYREGINLDIWSHSWVFCYPAICDCQTPCCKGQVSIATSSSLIILTNGGWCIQF
jgi:hypothetical protein